MLSNFKRAVVIKGFKDNTDEKRNKKINKINKQPN